MMGRLYTRKKLDDFDAPWSPLSVKHNFQLAVQRRLAQRVQCDEIWSFTYAKEAHVLSAKGAPRQSGDTWTST